MMASRCTCLCDLLRGEALEAWRSVRRQREAESKGRSEDSDRVSEDMIRLRC